MQTFVPYAVLSVLKFLPVGGRPHAHEGVAVDAELQKYSDLLDKPPVPPNQLTLCKRVQLVHTSPFGWPGYRVKTVVPELVGSLPSKW